MALNTSGLNEAYSRQQKGQANAADQANLKFAMSKGWQPSSGSGAAPIPSYIPTVIPEGPGAGAASGPVIPPGSPQGVIPTQPPKASAPAASSAPQPQAPAYNNQVPAATGVYGATNTGATATGINGIFSQIINQAQERQTMMDQRNKIITHLFDHKLTPDEMQGLPQSTIDVLNSGDPALAGMAVQMLNDQIKGRVDENMQNLQYMFNGYAEDQNHINTLQTAAQARQDSATANFQAMITKYGGAVTKGMSQQGIDAISQGLALSPQDAAIAYKNYGEAVQAASKVTLVPLYDSYGNRTGTMSLQNGVVLSQTGSGSPGNGSVGDGGGSSTNQITFNGQAFDSSNYAADPSSWTTAVQGIISNIQQTSGGQFTSPQSIDAYIQQTQSGSPITGSMIANTTGVPWEVLTAVMQHESMLGTSSVAKNNNNPGGITWTQSYQDSHPGVTKGTARPANEGGNYVKFSSMQDGVNATAEQIAKRATTQQSSQGSSVPGTTGNPKIDTSAQGYSSVPVPNAGGLTQAAIDKAAFQVAIGQPMPAGARGTKGAALAQANAIKNRAAEMDPNGNMAEHKAELTALANSLNTQVDYVTTLTRSVSTADASFNQVLNAFQGAGINTSDATILNQNVNDLSKKFSSSGDLRAFQASLQEVGNDYTAVFGAKTGTDVATRQRAQDIFDGNLTLGDLQKINDQIQSIGKIGIDNANKTVTGLQSQMDNILAPTPVAPASTPTDTGTGGGQGGNLSVDDAKKQYGISY